MTSNVTPFSMAHSVAIPATNTSSQSSTPGSDKERTFHFWRGASGRRYVHIVHSIVECPDLAASNYVLVRVDAGGVRTPLRIDRTTSAHGFENLAEIRYHAARLGATEVHLHVLADTPHAQAITQWDLEANHFGALIAETNSSVQQSTVNA